MYNFTNGSFHSTNQDRYYVVCDPAGSPFLYFSPGGGLAKEVSRSPYGHVTYDSNPAIRSHIGMFGGIQVTGNNQQQKVVAENSVIVRETECKWWPDSQSKMTMVATGHITYCM